MRDAIALAGYLDNANVKAFMRVIRAGETAQVDDAYRWLYGSKLRSPKLFDSYADHPRVRTYEAYDGQFIKNGKIDYTTAAGAFQITESTWDGLVQRLGFTEFSPRNQDLACLALIDEKGALDDVAEGRIVQAMFKCRRVWASLPASDYGQPTQTTRNALAVYASYGGQLANLAAPIRETPVAIAPAPITAPAPTKEEPAMAPLAPLLIGLAGNLIEVFSPLAREKIQKEMARHSDNPQVVAEITNNVIDTAKVLTGKADPVEAVAAAKADPAVVQQVESDALATLERLAPILDKLAAAEREARALDEASMDAAAARASREPNDQDVVLTRSIIGLMIGLLLAVGLLIGILSWLKVDGGVINTLVGLFITLAGGVGSQFTQRYQHRYGSSRGSGVKDVMMAELNRRK